MQDGPAEPPPSREHDVYERRVNSLGEGGLRLETLGNGRWIQLQDSERLVFETGAPSELCVVSYLGEARDPGSGFGFGGAGRVGSQWCSLG